MASYRILCAGLALLGAAATLSGHNLVIRSVQSDPPAVDINPELSNIHQDTLRLVTVVMRHEARAPADSYPNDPYINDTMEPYGWGQLTNKGRKNAYRTGEFFRTRYGKFLGNEYNPEKYWLQTSSIDRTKMSGLILSAALWKPNEKQTFLPGTHWQPVSLHYWERREDRLLLIWNACPRLTLERMQVENATEVRRFNEGNQQLFNALTNITGLPIISVAHVASLYSTLKAELAMGLRLPDWTGEYFPRRVEEAALFSLSMNVFTDNLRKLAGGPLVKKIVESMTAKTLDELEPKRRKMYLYVGHDSTLVNLLSAMQIWNGRDPDFGCAVMIELHETNGRWEVQIFQKNSVDTEPYALTVPGCEPGHCPLHKFAQLMKTVIPDDYDKDCKVDDPNYVIPSSPAA